MSTAFAIVCALLLAGFLVLVWTTTFGRVWLAACIALVALWAAFVPGDAA